jgi:hypothetical protein
LRGIRKACAGLTGMVETRPIGSAHTCVCTQGHVPAEGDTQVSVCVGVLTHRLGSAHTCVCARVCERTTLFTHMCVSPDVLTHRPVWARKHVCVHGCAILSMHTRVRMCVGMPTHRPGTAHTWACVRTRNRTIQLLHTSEVCVRACNTHTRVCVCAHRMGVCQGVVQCCCTHMSVWAGVHTHTTDSAHNMSVCKD